MEIFRLFGSIFINNDEANKSLEKTDEKAEGVTGKLTKGIGTAAKWGLGLVTATGAAVGGMIGLASQTAGVADEIDKLSERTGISRENLQKWKYAAGQSGADIGKLEVGVKKLSDVMDGAVNGSKANIEAFNQLGISLNDLKTKSQEQIFEDVMFALSDMEQGAQRNALGNDLLGKSYTEMLPLLNAGSDGMEALRIRAEELGLVMSEENVKANVKFGDSMDDIKQSLGMVTANVTNQLLPMLNDILNWILEHMPEIQEVTGTVFKVLGDTVKWVTDNLNWLLPVLGGLLVSLGALQIINTVNTLMALWKASTFAQTLAQSGLNAALSANPIGLVVIGIGLLVAAILYLWNNCEWFRNGLLALWEGLKQYFFNVVIPFWKALFNAVAGVFTSIWNSASSVIGNIKNIFSNLIDFIKNVFTGNWRGAWQNVLNIFSNIWDAMKTIYKAPLNAMISGLNAFIRGINKIKIPDWVPGLGGKGINIPTIPGFAVGTRYLPKDMLIQAHEGEMIVPKSENPYANSGGDVLPSSGPLFIIENFNNNREQDVKAFAEELEFYRNQYSKAKGGAY